ncbi:hypothetical protein [Parafrankia sp. FMc2]|uniref:hypothetical protein n=1 Tax=Parafrankia sp. FMc2 TaxID=3233196 RepID=UPI0034D49941
MTELVGGERPRLRLSDIERRLVAGAATVDDVIDLIAEVRRLRGVEDLVAGMLFDSVVTYQGSTTSPLDLLERYNPHLRGRLRELRQAAATLAAVEGTVARDRAEAGTFAAHAEAALTLARAGRGTATSRRRCWPRRAVGR